MYFPAAAEPSAIGEHVRSCTEVTRGSMSEDTCAHLWIPLVQRHLQVRTAVRTGSSPADCEDQNAPCRESLSGQRCGEHPQTGGQHRRGLSRLRHGS